MKKKILTLAIACGMAAGPLYAEDEAMIIQVNRLSMETAMKVAKGAVDACRKEGIQIGATVVDRDGIVQAQLRDTIAARITLSISKNKAFTAVQFNAATSAMADRAGTPIGQQPGLVMSAGGIPIQVGGSLMGGVGVSGAPSGETDEKCAQAGIDEVMTDLEMAM